MTNFSCTVVVHTPVLLQEHVLKFPGALMMSSSVHLGKGTHFEAPIMANVFAGQGSHFVWPENMHIFKKWALIKYKFFLQKNQTNKNRSNNKAKYWAHSPQKPATVVKVVDWQLPTIYTEGTMERFNHMANSYASFFNIATKERVF